MNKRTKADIFFDKSGDKHYLNILLKGRGLRMKVSEKDMNNLLAQYNKQTKTLEQKVEDNVVETIDIL